MSMVITATTLQAILRQVYDQKDLWEVAQHYIGEEKTDLFHDLILQLGEKEQNTMLMYQNGILKYYCINTIQTMAIQPSSSFHRKRKGFFKEDPNRIKDNLYSEQKKTIEQREKEENFYDRCRGGLIYKETYSEKKRFNIRTIFELYFENGLSIRKISKCTKGRIPPSTVFKYLKEIKLNIKNNII